MKQLQNIIETIIGHKGYGKTVFTEKLAILKNRPTVILDPRFQYQENIRRIVFTSVSNFRRWIMNKDNYKVFMSHKLELVVRTIDDAEELASLVYKMKKIVFVIDEIDMFFDVHTNKKSFFNQLVQYGRHNEIDIISTSRRPANIHRNLTSLTDAFYFSRLREPNDQKYIKALLGNEYVEKIKGLEKFSFLKCEDEEKEVIRTNEKDVRILQA